MCGRFTLGVSPEAIAQAFQLALVPEWAPRYNIAPTQKAPAVVHLLEAEARQFKLLQWGLVPSWSKDPKIGSRMINARSETVLEKPSFRTPFRRTRCLVPSDGFYEWRQTDDGKQPVFIRMKDQGVFAFAGLWDHWEGEGQVLETFTILTTEANELLEPLHHRMPVILKPEDHDLWLDPGVGVTDVLLGMLRPHEADVMETFAVSKRVNSPKNDSPECVQPLDEVV